MPTKILAIDDSKTMRLAIKITFAAEDCEVVAVSKGSEAVARAKQMPADVLIVDAVLAAGEPSGYDVARQLRADPETAHIPVLILVSNQTGQSRPRSTSSLAPVLSNPRARLHSVPSGTVGVTALPSPCRRNSTVSTWSSR